MGFTQPARLLVAAILIAGTLSLPQTSEAVTKKTDELDLDEAWGSETFSSSATLIREEMKDSASNAAASAAEKANDLKKVALTRKKMKPIKEVLDELQLKDVWMEAGFLAFIIVYLINIFVGTETNKRIAYAWAQEFTTEGSILERNFSHLGISDEAGTEVTLLKEGAAEYKFYASGRRFCSGMAVTLDLRPRMDIFKGYVLNLLLPQDDIVDLEIHMNEASMPKTVLSIATTRLAREMLRRDDCYEDLKLFTRKMDVAKDRLPTWPHDKLIVLAEQPSIFYDLMTETMVDQVFGRAAFEEFGQYFRALRFTSDGEGKHKQIAQFSFTLPAEGEMEKLSRWMAAAMVFIDLLGNYKMRPEQKAKAEKARQEAATSARSKEEEAEERMEKLRAKKREEEQEKLKRMSPAEREKYKARAEKLERERRARRMSKVVRS